VTEDRELFDPIDCDWCGKQYEYGDGGMIAGDNVCIDCLQHNKEIQ
jgi:hypothetical protein